MVSFFIKYITEPEIELITGRENENIENGLFGRLDVVVGEKNEDFFSIYKSFDNRQLEGRNDLDLFVKFLRNSQVWDVFNSQKSLECFYSLFMNERFRPFKNSKDVCFYGETPRNRFYVRLSPQKERNAVIYCYNKSILKQISIINGSEELKAGA